MTRITIENDAVRIIPEGLDRIWGFQGAFEVPLSAIGSVHVDPDIARSFPGVRAPGLAWFARKVGTFRKRGYKAYWNTSRYGDTLVIECNGAKFDAVVLTVDDPAAERERILTAKGWLTTPGETST